MSYAHAQDIVLLTLLGALMGSAIYSWVRKFILWIEPARKDGIYDGTHGTWHNEAGYPSKILHWFYLRGRRRGIKINNKYRIRRSLNIRSRSNG